MKNNYIKYRAIAQILVTFIFIFIKYYKNYNIKKIMKIIFGKERSFGLLIVI